MKTDDVVVKRVPAVRVAEMSAVVRSYGPEDISPVLGPLFDELCRRLADAGVTPVGPGIAYYEDVPGGDGILAHAAMPVAVTPADDGLAVVDLPAIERAATIVHRGSMDDVLPTAQTLARWIADGGHRSAGYARELYLEAGGDPAGWVTELQEPLAD